MNTHSNTYKNIFLLFHFLVIFPCIGLLVWGAFEWHRGFFGWFVRAAALWVAYSFLKACLYAYLDFMLKGTIGHKIMLVLFALISLPAVAFLGWGTCAWNLEPMAWVGRATDVVFLWFLLTIIVKGAGFSVGLHMPAFNGDEAEGAAKQVPTTPKPAGPSGHKTTRKTKKPVPKNRLN